MQTGSNTEGCIATDGTYCWVAQRQSNAINLWPSTLVVKISALQLKNQSFPTKRHAPKKWCCNVASASSWAIWCRSHLGTVIPSGYMPSLVRLGCPNASRAASKLRRSSCVQLQCFGMRGELSSQLVVEYSHLGHPASLARSSASSRAFLAWSCLKYVV